MPSATKPRKLDEVAQQVANEYDVSDQVRPEEDEPVRYAEALGFALAHHRGIKLPDQQKEFALGMRDIHTQIEA
jgi:hypothetical protein